MKYTEYFRSLHLPTLKNEQKKDDKGRNIICWGTRHQVGFQILFTTFFEFNRSAIVWYMDLYSLSVEWVNMSWNISLEENEEHSSMELTANQGTLLSTYSKQLAPFSPTISTESSSFCPTTFTVSISSCSGDGSASFSASGFSSNVLRRSVTSLPSYSRFMPRGSARHDDRFRETSNGHRSNIAFTGLRLTDEPRRFRTLDCTE